MEKSTEKNGRVPGSRSGKGGTEAADVTSELKERGEQMLQQARTAVTDFSERLDLKGRVESNPIGMVAAALGIGYVLGGGLFTRFTGSLFRLGVRLAVIPAVKYALVDRATEMLRGSGETAATETPRY